MNFFYHRIDLKVLRYFYCHKVCDSSGKGFAECEGVIYFYVQFYKLIECVAGVCN
jgi:hypothetical protein